MSTQERTLQSVKALVDRSIDMFEPQVQIVYGGRGSGKTTVLVAIDVIAEERGLRSLVVVPFSDMGKHHVGIKENMLQAAVRESSSSGRSRHYFTVQRLGRESGLRPDVLLVEEWGTLSVEDQVRVYRFWQMWRPPYTFVAVYAPSSGQNLYVAPAQFDFTSLSEKDMETAPKGTPPEQVYLTPNLRSRPSESKLW